MRRNSILVILSIACIATKPFAQVNTEKFRGSEISPGLSGLFQVDFSLRSGNVEIMEVDLENQTFYNWNSRALLVVLRENFGRESGVQFSNEGLAHLRFMQRIKPKLMLEVFSQSNFNRERLLDLRLLLGGGLRFSLFRTSAWQVGIGVGYMIEHEELDLKRNPIHPLKTTVQRFSQYFAFRYKYNEQIAANFVSYYQPDINALDDYRILLEGDLIISLGKVVSLSVSLISRFDSKAPDQIKSVDTALKSGVRFNF